MMLAGTLLLCAAFVLAWLNIQEDRRAGETSRAVVMQIRQTMEQPAAAATAQPEAAEVARSIALATAQPDESVTAQPIAASATPSEAVATAQPIAASAIPADALVTAQPAAASAPPSEAVATAQPTAAAAAPTEVVMTAQPTAQPDAQRITLPSALLKLLKLLPDALMSLFSSAQPGVQPAPQLTPMPVMPTFVPVMEDLAVLDVEPDFIRDPDMEMPVTEVDGHAYIGVLDIPRLERSLPVMSAWSYPKLKIAPCLYTGSIYSHDAVLSAHNYEEHLRYLWQLEPGDEVRFTDVSGNVFIYEVILQEILAPYEVERMTTRTDWDLTLFTCKTGGRMRITTRCALKSYIVAPSAQTEE